MYNLKFCSHKKKRVENFIFMRYLNKLRGRKRNQCHLFSYKPVHSFFLNPNLYIINSFVYIKCECTKYNNE